jgi:hypothetical protein
MKINFFKKIYYTFDLFLIGLLSNLYYKEK